MASGFDQVYRFKGPPLVLGRTSGGYSFALVNEGGEGNRG